MEDLWLYYTLEMTCKRVNMQFNDEESMRLEELQKHYGIRQLTELIRFIIKMQYNSMIAQND